MRRAVTAVVVLALVGGAALLAVWVRDRYVTPPPEGDPSVTTKPPITTQPMA